MNGIMFKPWKQKAIRENPDREWMTRRVIKFNVFPNIVDSDWHAPWFDNVLNEWVFSARFGLAARSQRLKSRYQVNEILYIKEAWAVNATNDNRKPREISSVALVYYKDSDSPITLGKRRSPLFMPAWAARDFIQITAVRAERLQEITAKDCVAEGYPGGDIPEDRDGKQMEISKLMRLGWFQATWNSINPKYPWEDNPWVFVYLFKKVERP